MRYFIVLIVLAFSGCKKDFFQLWSAPDTYNLCKQICYSFAQDYSKVRQYSMGTCICDNKYGNEVARAYHLYLNNKCNKTNEEEYQ